MRLFKKLFSAMLLTLATAILMAAPLHATQPEDLVLLHYWTGSLSSGINDMVNAYNRTAPGQKVRATGFEHEAFKVSIQAMLASGSPPDMFSYWAGAKVQSLVDQDYLAPIDLTWSQAGLDKVFPAAVGKACTYNGHKYGLPLTQHYVAFFYNKAIFDQHNIRPPTEWQEFIRACDTLKQAGVIPVALGSRERWPAQFWFDYLLLRTAGPKYRQRLMEGRASYADPEVEKAFALWKELIDAGYFNTSPNQLDWAEASKLVHSGQAAMTLMGTWVIGLFDGQLGWKQGQDYDFFRFPTMDAAVPMTALGPIDAIVVSREGRSAQASKVLTYFSDPGPQMEMSRGSGALSPSRAIPSSFYTPMQGRILSVIRKTPHWAFNYDLATPPTMAEFGLTGFKRFLNNPSDYKDVLSHLNELAQRHFKNTLIQHP